MKIPQKYWWLNYGSGIRVLHVFAETDTVDGVKDFVYTSDRQSIYEYQYGRRIVRVVNDSNIDNLFRTGRIINNSIKGFDFYCCTGEEYADPGVEIYVGDLVDDSYNITIRRKG